MIQRFKIGDLVRITPDVARAHFSCPNCDVFRITGVEPTEIVGMARYEMEHVRTKLRRTVFDDGLRADQETLEWVESEPFSPDKIKQEIQHGDST